MALNYLMREKKEDNICDSFLQEMALYCGTFQEGIYLCPMFHFGLQREKNKQMFKYRYDVFVAELSPIEILRTRDQVKNVYSYSSCHWSFSSITRRIQK